MNETNLDTKGLIRESYLIEGITASECRSIFVDWALSLPAGVDSGAAIRQMLATEAAAHPDHPMTATLREGLTPAQTPTRKGGRRARVPGG